MEIAVSAGRTRVERSASVAEPRVDDRERCLFGFRREVAAEHIGEQGVDHGMKTLVDEDAGMSATIAATTLLIR